jgi:hypothetical protein
VRHHGRGNCWHCATFEPQALPHISLTTWLVPFWPPNMLLHEHGSGQSADKGRGFCLDGPAESLQARRSRHHCKAHKRLDPFGRNWMRSSILTTYKPCFPPCLESPCAIPKCSKTLSAYPAKKIPNYKTLKDTQKRS